jgi:hypothetical protein
MRFFKSIPVKMYDSDLKFIICEDMGKEFNRIAKRKKDLNVSFSGDAGGLAFSYSIHEYYVLLRADSVAHSYIAHEVLHIVERMTKDRGIRDEESRAYLCGFLTKMVYESLHKAKIKVANG